MAEKRQISPEQMVAMVSHLHDNNRPVQPLGERQIGLRNRRDSAPANGRRGTPSPDQKANVR
jgi:hypothetical protein